MDTSTDTDTGGGGLGRDEGAVNLRTGSAKYLGESVLRLLYVVSCMLAGAIGGIGAASLGLSVLGSPGAHGYGGVLYMFAGMVFGGSAGLAAGWYAIRRLSRAGRVRLALGIVFLACVFVIPALLIEPRPPQ